MRLTGMMSVVGVAVVATFAIAQDTAKTKSKAGTSETRIAAAKESYLKAIEKARNSARRNLERDEKAIQKRGNLEHLRQVKKQLAKLERGPIPAATISSADRRQIARARELLLSAYSIAIREYVRSGDAVAAEKLEVERNNVQNSQPIVTAEIPADAQEFKKHYYKVYSDELKWHEAFLECQRRGGRLAIVVSADQNRFLTELANDAKMKTVWLGGSDAESEGLWTWINGSTMAYSNWDQGQPNNYNFGPDGEDYLLLRVDKRGLWWDLPDEAARGGFHPGYICEW
jgi:Lectin C-type domain